MSVHRAPHKTDFQESTQQSLMDYQPSRFLFAEKPQEIKAQRILFYDAISKSLYRISKLRQLNIYVCNLYIYIHIYLDIYKL